jgi:hypothetical protein
MLLGSTLVRLVAALSSVNQGDGVLGLLFSRKSPFAVDHGAQSISIFSPEERQSDWERPTIVERSTEASPTSLAQHRRHQLHSPKHAS